ncbi:TetR/AcrR family transcriptional regulator [Clostridium vitabionis]|uniref:TetR/AcrR family transcriptional regulator n=1 Tax=Clostridium vitabionis TaxID=2784388 RepID=UPI001A9A6F37|nr:TetR/AcrR family transcriptional regulator [Clostridium vitabionis]
MDTKEAIKAQFMKMYAQKDFQVITVKALCAATPVARTTFYSYFDNTDDVRCEVENDLIKGLLKVSQDVSSGNLPDMDFSRFMDEIEGYIKDNWTYI